MKKIYPDQKRALYTWVLVRLPDGSKIDAGVSEGVTWPNFKRSILRKHSVHIPGEMHAIETFVSKNALKRHSEVQEYKFYQTGRQH